MSLNGRNDRMSVTTNHGFIERTIARLPPLLADPGPELRIKELSLEDKAKYATGRLLRNASCNISEFNGDEIHGRWRYNTGDYSKHDLDELVRQIKLTLDGLVWPDYSYQLVAFDMRSSKQIDPIDASDITMILAPRR